MITLVNATMDELKKEFRVSDIEVDVIESGFWKTITVHRYNVTVDDQTMVVNECHIKTNLDGDKHVVEDSFVYTVPVINKDKNMNEHLCGEYENHPLISYYNTELTVKQYAESIIINLNFKKGYPDE